MSAVASAWALEVTTGSSTTKLVLLVLADRHNKDTGKCCPSIALIAKDSELSETTVKKALRDLTKAGLITRERRQRTNGSDTTNQFVLHMGGGRETTPLGVTAAPLEPEVEPEEDLSRAPRSTKPNIVWDALVEVTGFDPKTTSEKSDFGKTVRELRAIIPAEATADDVAKAMRARRRAWEREYPDAAFTHRVLRGKWAELEVLARRLLSPSDRRGEEIPERMEPEQFRSWRATASREAIADYQHRFDVDDQGESLDEGF